MPGAVVDNLMSFDANRLPKDSGYSASDFSATAHEHDHNDLNNIQGGAADNNYHLTSVQHTDLTDGNNSDLHYHDSDRDRANHTGTQTASTISDFDTEVGNHVDVTANTTARHDRAHALDSDADHSALSDIETFNATTAKHGLLPKLDNDNTHYLDGEGNWTEPPDTASEGGMAIEITTEGGTQTVDHDYMESNWEDFEGGIESITIDQFGHIEKITASSGSGGPAGPGGPNDDICDQNDHPGDDDQDQGGGSDGDDGTGHPDDEEDSNGSGDDGSGHPSNPDCYSTIPDPIT